MPLISRKIMEQRMNCFNFLDTRFPNFRHIQIFLPIRWLYIVTRSAFFSLRLWNSVLFLSYLHFVTDHLYLLNRHSKLLPVNKTDQYLHIDHVWCLIFDAALLFVIVRNAKKYYIFSSHFHMIVCTISCFQ